MYLRVLGHSFMKQLKRKYRQKQMKEYFQFSGHHNSRGRGGGGVGVVVSYEMGRDARRKIQIIPLRDVGVAQA